MKILHINYSDKSGGAGIAAYRHNEAMNRIGLNSNMLVVLKMTRDNTIYVLRKNRVQLQVLDNLYNFLHSFVIRRFKPRADFCYALFGHRVDKHPLVQQADAIYLHWINASTLSIHGIERLLKTGKPIFWYMHDMYPLTGGCHHAFQCTKYDALTVYESIRPTKLYSRSYDPYTDSSVIEFGTNLKMAKKNQDTIAGNTINNCSVLAAFGNCNVGKTKLNDVYDYFAKQVKDVLAPGMLLLGYVKRHLDKDKDGNLKKFILNFLKDSDFNIEDVTLHEEEELITPELEQLIQKAPIADDAKSEMLKKGKITNTELTFTHRTGNSLYELSEEYESNGTMRFLGMGIILNFLLKNNQFVPIDEVETSIHYELLSYFIKVFLANSNQTSQMLLTTHDINLLNEEFIRRDTIWFTDKDEQGETNVVRLSALGLHKNLSPYNAYKQGKLVKLPFLGSQYFDLND